MIPVSANSSEGIGCGRRRTGRLTLSERMVGTAFMVMSRLGWRDIDRGGEDNIRLCSTKAEGTNVCMGPRFEVLYAIVFHL